MALASNYLLNLGKVEDYFEAIRGAQPPERFTHKFLENLGFSSSNDRLLIGMLKDLGFLNQDAVPQQRYFEYLDSSRSRQVIAEALRDTFSNLFAVNTNAHEMTAPQVENKLRTLYAGKYSDLTVKRIAKTFVALSQLADFSSAKQPRDIEPVQPVHPIPPATTAPSPSGRLDERRVQITGLQYHINIALPESRDQAVYDAIFRSLREHLG